MPDDKLRDFQTLASEAQACRRCEALCGRVAVLSELNGNLRPKVMFVAEAPGRQGANRTRIPFSGDQSGVNLQMLLDSIELERDAIFITNTVLCHPHKPNGANRKPTVGEIKNCSEFLARTINLVDPKIIATLGAVALEALKTIEYHQFALRSDAAKILRWNGRLLVALYHPSPQVIASHRRRSEQLADFQILKRAIEEMRRDEQGNPGF